LRCLATQPANIFHILSFRRWFKTNNEHLVYYADSESQTVLASLSLKEVTSIELVGDRELWLELEMGKNYYHIRAASPEDAQLWMTTLKGRCAAVQGNAGESSDSGGGSMKRFSTTAKGEEDVVETKQTVLPPPPPPDEEGEEPGIAIFRPLLPAPADIARKSGQLVRRANLWYEATIASADSSWEPSAGIKACLKPLAHEDGVDANGVAILEYRQRSLDAVEQSGMSTEKQRQRFMEKLHLVKLLALKLPACRPAGLDHYFHEMQDLRDETLLEIAMHCRTRINPVYDQDAVLVLVVDIVDLMALAGRDYATFDTEAKRHPSNDEGPDERGSNFSREDLMLLSAAHHMWQLVLQGGARKETKNKAITNAMLSRTVQTMDTPDWGERDMLVTSMHQVLCTVYTIHTIH
jgi:hypothetical protein